MSKDYGPKHFEKAWIKSLKGFDETKIFFKHEKSQTILQYIDNGKLLGVEMYRSQFEIERWLNHFQHFLDTGVFDTDSYWIEYSHKNGERIEFPEIYSQPMKLENQIWHVHSKEHSDFMKNERAAKGDLGFKHVPKPITE